MGIKKRNILVCITPQANSKRLIDKGSQIADGGRLNILYVQRGKSVFDNADASKLLEELFEYGKTKGGTVHFLSGDDFYVTVKVFALSNKITHIVVGEPPVEIMANKEFEERVLKELKGIEVVILERPKEQAM